MKFKSVVWASTIDYPDEVSTVLFVGTCNWDCEYCYNKNLKDKKDIDFMTEILPRLLDRKDFVNHVVISGGECTLYNELESIIDILKNNGFTVGIHTNGSKPNILQRILPKIDFVGMDIKTVLSNKTDYKNTKQSITNIIFSGVKYEFRTTLYPKYIDLTNCYIIAGFLSMLGVKEWILQEYTNEFNKELPQPYTKSEINKLIIMGNEYLPTRLKGE